LALALQACVPRKAFDEKRFDRLLVGRPGLKHFKDELTDDVYNTLAAQTLKC
jgi:hypothetical protein